MMRLLLEHLTPLLALVLLTLASVTGCDNGVGPVLPDDFSSDEAPAWSPTGGRIAYFHAEHGRGRPGGYPTGLYVLDLATGERSLVRGGYASNPDWSPNGDRLAFDAGDLFTVRPDGSDLRRVTRHGSAFFPRYAPDGATLSYGRSGTQEVVGLWFAHLGDSTAIRLTRLGFGASPADWSPDGQRIVYEGPRGEADRGNQIWVADTSAINKQQITRHGSVNSRAAWSPNGQWIAWTADSGLRIMRADGSEQRDLVRHASGPAFSPNSERIVFTAPLPDRSRAVLWTVRLDGSDLEQLTF